MMLHSGGRFRLLIAESMKENALCAWHFAPSVVFSHGAATHSIYICQEFGPSLEAWCSLPPSAGAASLSLSLYRKIIKARPTCEHHCSKINNRKVGRCEIYLLFAIAAHTHTNCYIRKGVSRARTDWQTLPARRFCAPAAFLISHTRRKCQRKGKINNISGLCFAAAGIALFFFTNAVDTVGRCALFCFHERNKYPRGHRELQ